MLTTLNTKSLTSAVSAILWASSPRDRNPVLRGVRIEAHNGAVVLECCNEEQRATITVASTVTRPGVAIVDAKAFAAAIRGKSEAITLESTETGLILGCHRMPFVADDSAWPLAAPTAPESATLYLSGKQLKRIHDATAFAVSDEETRHNLRGTLWHIVDGLLTTVATDGQRLAELKTPVGMSGTWRDVILPKYATPQIVKAMGKSESIAVEQRNSGVTFRSGNLTIHTTEIDGTFPDYARVIPAQFSGAATFNRTDLLDAMAAVKLPLPSRETQCVRIDIYNTGHVDLVQHSQEHGTAHVKTRCTVTGSEPDAIGADRKHLVACLESLTDSTVTVSHVSSSEPLVMTEPGYTVVLMPMRCTGKGDHCSP